MEATAEPLDETRGTERFLRRLDWSAFWTAGILTFIVYLYTLAPTVSLEDSGELAVASDYLGVPHPPGYPIWTMITWLFTRVFSFVKYLGQPNPAWSVGLVSALFGALAAGVTAMLICRSGSDMLRESRDAVHTASHSVEDTLCWVGGVVGSLVFAFSPAMWSQSVIVEVYSLNAFFLVLIFLLTYRWMRQPSPHLLYVTAFVFGLGLTNYQVLLLAALPLAIVILLRDTELLRDFAIVGAPFGIVMFLIRQEILPPIVRPHHMTCYVYMSLNFLLLALAYFLLPRGKTVATTFFLAELGVAFYAYMPLSSDFRNPPMNWGYPRTWEGFKHALSRGQYEKIKPTDVFSMKFIHQVGAYLTDVRRQFTLPLALLGFLPFTIWQVRIGERRIRALTCAVALCVAASAIVVLEKAFFAGATPLSGIYKFIIAGVIFLVAVGGLAIVVSRVKELLLILTGRTRATWSERITIGLIGVGLLAALLLYVIMLAGKLGDVTAPLRAGQTVTGQLLMHILAQTLGILVLILMPFALGALVIWLMRGNLELRLSIGGNSEKWVVATLMGFVSMSIVLMVLANPKGDIQDDFIQRVKFISSHALYALWMGYGLIFGLAYVDTLFKGDAAVRWAGLGVALMLPLVPAVYLNGYDHELLRRYGGVEQNGHDFGWQFGNYQLRGAEAISEELVPGEEPLPNPAFPPEMGQDAIFFGGTDPGRFVPTYMIYSARVREDVYLITQNALADNTYMSVMRDLYGDQIWIPAQPDSAKAFQRYVDEVKSGKRPRNAELKIENGRVQVSGALGVMEINGILAQMIFEHNNYRHNFYVEESYVIRWMYPYLEPHGLIMRINPKRIKLNARMLRNDGDFWDWYTRRLAGSRKFRRDVVARKSFSKLRSAIGGLYANRGKLDEAENAFQQARILYSLSPEANFRLAQEVLMRKYRFGEARELIAEFKKQDPGNRTVPGFLKNLGKLQKIQEQVTALEAKRKDGSIDTTGLLSLAEAYLQMQQHGQFMQLINGIMADPKQPSQILYRVALLLRKAKRFPEMDRAIRRCIETMPKDAPSTIYLDIARLYSEARLPDRIVDVMARYLAREPGDWKGWLDMATLQLSLKKTKEAEAALQQAVKHGGAEAIALIKKDKRFADVRKQVMSRARSLMNLPSAPTTALPRSPDTRTPGR